MNQLESSFDSAQQQRDNELPDDESNETRIERKIENENERADHERECELR
jgi:hypothetical protein